MNDWWDYLEHGTKGQERKGHKYYARVPVGTNKLGFTKYRYFYDAREYGAYMTRKNRIQNFVKYNSGIGNAGTVHYNENGHKDDKKTTYYVTGSGTMTSDKYVKGDIKRSKESGRDAVRIHSDKNGNYTGSSASVGKKTMKDHKVLRKAERNVKNAAEKGRKKVASLLRKAAGKLDS